MRPKNRAHGCRSRTRLEGVLAVFGEIRGSGPVWDVESGGTVCVLVADCQWPQSRARLKPETMRVTFEEFSPTHDFFDYKGSETALFALFWCNNFVHKKNGDSANGSTQALCVERGAGAYSFLRNAPAKQSLDRLLSCCRHSWFISAFTRLCCRRR
jgi:hypothetical protein